MEKIYLGIGTNLGDRELNLRRAIDKINDHIGTVVHLSSVYETEPVGFSSGDMFLNLAAEVDSIMEPDSMIDKIMQIETLLGRIRKAGRYGSRVIDIDILMYGQTIIKSDLVTVPHPRLHERKFVLVPLCELAPDFVHPLLKKSIRILLDECSDKSFIQKYPVILEI